MLTTKQNLYYITLIKTKIYIGWNKTLLNYGIRVIHPCLANETDLSRFLVNRYRLVKYRECCIQIDTSPGIIVGRVIYGSLYLGDTFWSCIQIDTNWVYWENERVLDQSVPLRYRLSYYCGPLQLVVSWKIQTEYNRELVVSEGYILKNTTASYLDWYRLRIIDRTSEFENALYLYDGYLIIQKVIPELILT